MKRVVVTGIGILSSIGNDKNTVLNSLKLGQSGIVFVDEMKKSGMRSHIAGKIILQKNLSLDRKVIRFMNNAAIYAYLATIQAIQDSSMSKEIYQKNPRIGIVAGSSIGSPRIHISAVDVMRKRNRVQSINPYSVIKSMSSCISACLSTALKIYGISYSISSACSTSAHCIGNAFELIQLGKQDIIFAGGAEEVTWELACEFDAMGVLSTRYNLIPELASRPYDMNRDGFVISEGAGILVLEELNHAKLRDAPIYAEVVGYGTTSSGYKMVESSELSIERAMKESLKYVDINSVDYLNTHATSTVNGDMQELNAVRNVFKDYELPLISSTKSMTGHSLGASGVQEAIYSLLMLNNNFVAPSTNINDLDKSAVDMNIIRNTVYKEMNIVMSNSLGFGGVNVSLVFKKI
ncbi:3-oxoacyl-[acyl-carrier-protein] synthase 1 [Buchnera aphidicola (Eriosoma lanigerum)]|uniref:beta-ketoacyl synthase N-terminal-like domain-containing protein n=1 Tax=Buchnera aphidicola TaxID=9 RepID=UPI00346421C4